MIQTKKIQFSEEAEHALSLMENTEDHIFLTGKAGTGKSTLLNFYRENTKKKAVFLAPTGIAAINIKGQTIHSFFKFGLDINPAIAAKMQAKTPKLYKSIDTIVIDEVSMLRADLLDCIDIFMRRYGKNVGIPFGGIQMIYVGDLFQLPPVVTADAEMFFREQYISPYFFHASVMSLVGVEVIELQEVYRQKDIEFISLLDAIRTNTATMTDLAVINKRYIPIDGFGNHTLSMYLTTTNALSNTMNEARLSSLKTKAHTLEAEISGKIDRQYYPTESTLLLKEQSQVMFLNNDTLGRWVNGTLGTVSKIQNKEDDTILKITLENGKTYAIEPYTWELYAFTFDEGSLQSHSIGSFTQYPIKLAWSVTIHKSQGKTFDKIVLDIGRGTFAPGQLYVALSRCRTLDGIYLKQKIQPRNIMTDPRVVEFMVQNKNKKRL